MHNLAALSSGLGGRSPQGRPTMRQPQPEDHHRVYICNSRLILLYAFFRLTCSVFLGGVPPHVARCSPPSHAAASGSGRLCDCSRRVVPSAARRAQRSSVGRMSKRLSCCASSTTGWLPPRPSTPRNLSLSVRGGAAPMRSPSHKRLSPPATPPHPSIVVSGAPPHALGTRHRAVVLPRRLHRGVARRRRNVSARSELVRARCSGVG